MTEKTVKHTKSCHCGHSHDHKEGSSTHKNTNCSCGHSHKNGHIQGEHNTEGHCGCTLEHNHEDNHNENTPSPDEQEDEDEHSHQESCNHNSKSCGCGHKHDDKDGCGCGHEHDDKDGCGCGSEHTHSQGDSILPVIIALGLFVAGLLLEHVFKVNEIFATLAFAAATVIAGRKVFISGIKGLFKFKFNENVLMSIAIITAFCLGEFGEAAAVAILFFLGEIAEGSAERNSRKSIKALTEIRPDTARLILNGTEQLADAKTLKPGHIIAVNPFERIPVDGTVTQGTSYIDNSALTGEALPVNIQPGDALLSGGMNGSSRIVMMATSDFNGSTSSRILKLIEESGARKGETEKLITRFAKIYTPIVIVLAILITFIPPLFGLGSITDWLYRALVMLVASCPCALVISVPLGFFAGIGAQSKIGVLVKGGKYLEALARADSVCFDKTGTITTSALKISTVDTANGFTTDEVLRFAAACEANSTHPVAKALTSKNIMAAENIVEIPGMGITASLDGKSIIVGRRTYLENNGIAVEMAVGHTVYIGVDGKIAGGITLSDTIKEDSALAVANLKKLGIKRIAMLTGDNEKSARAVALACKIDEFHHSLLPADKAKFIGELDSSGRIFVGDGINDAPVLAAADCGIAIGLGSQAAIETADAVLSAGHLSALPKAISLARRTIKIIRFNIVFAIAFKAVILVLAALGYAPMWLGIVADVGVMIITVLNSMRLIKLKIN